MSKRRNILVCQCAERGLVDQDEVSRLIASGEVTVVADLCKAAAEQDPILAEVAAGDTPVVYACHPRAVAALFAYAGNALPENAQTHSLLQADAKATGVPSMQSDPAWFPVIDEARCSGCGQCHEFCLFGVYEKEPDGTIRVVNPGSCKNNCPACARICPETAIMFPKCGEAPINGAEISDEDERKANVRINVDEILGDDVYAALNARKQKRRALLNKKKIEKALAERKQCSGGSS
jgi:NAD-dependent dihydropyrimidine dehydrogenase PreA subunit